MGKKSKPPPAPDYTKLAQQTAASQKTAQTTADWANRPDQTDMYGNKTSWTSSAVRDPATGQMQTKWAQNTTLSPQQQQALDAQMRLQQGMMSQSESMLGSARNAMSQPFDTSKLNPWGQPVQAGNLDANAYQTTGAGEGMMAGLDTSKLGAMPQADAAERQRIENMLYERQNPERQRQQAGLEGKLANMGLTRGSAAWNRELQRLGDQHSRERYDAMATGGQEMERLFGMGMNQRQQGWNEMLGSGQFQNQAQQQAFNQRSGQNAQNFGMQQAAGNQNFNQQMQSSQYANQLRGNQFDEQSRLRQMPLNELNAFRSGSQVQNPNFQNFNTSQRAGAVDYSGAGQNQYNAGMDAYNAKQAQQQGMFSGLSGLASTAMMFSDRRLKSNIKRVGSYAPGVGLYEYDLAGQRQRGVLAQELVKVAPHLVGERGGFMTVNYGGL